MKSKALLKLLAAIMFALPALVTPLRAQNPPTYVTQFGSYGSGNGQFQNPFGGIAVDSSNNVYVTDWGNNRVEKFTSSGMYLAQWGVQGTGNGQFEDPTGIAVDSSNNVYVGDYRVQKFTSSGTYLTQFAGSGNGQFAYPIFIAVDSSNNVYVDDRFNNRVEKFDSNGNYLTQWGSQGNGNGQFVYPQGVAVDSSNNVYVSDTGNNRVEKFTSSGTYLAQWGSFGSGNGQFGAPEGIAVDSSNNVYVIDNENNRVEKFTSSGTYLTQWGTSGSGYGQSSSPAGVAVDDSGNYVYVTEDNDSVEVFVYNTSIIPPFIMQQPTNQVAAVGGNVIFTVGVVGGAPFAYQWNSNSIAIPAATNATFTLTNVSLSASGNYSVLVTNSYGSAQSSNAVLTVLPALVTTQPASGLSATGAVLNGSVTLGPDETVAWFEWGTDTNYGNITGATIVPGDNGSNSISATLSGLPGNFYHYRLDAANDFGIVYGNDQLFTVGFAPSATTLPATNGASGATLEAVVNPEGWDTTVYFQWETPTLASTTPGIDIGAGATSLNVSSFVPGLASATTYQYQVVASNALGTVVGEVAYDPNQQRYLFSTNITLPPGTYIITAYGAAGGGVAYAAYGIFGPGSYGAEMSAEFNFSTSTNLTLRVGGGGEGGAYYGNTYGSGGGFNYNGGGGGGGGSFVVAGSTPLVIAGGGGGGAIYFIGADGYYSAGGTGGITPGGEGGGIDGGIGGIGGSGGGGGGGGGDFGGGGGGGFLGSGDGGGVDGGTGGSSFGGGGGASGGGGGGGGYSGGGGGGGIDQFDVLYGYGGGGGGSIIDSSAIAILTEVSGIASPDDPANGEIIIIAVPPPPLAISTTDSAFGFTNGVFGFDVTGPYSSYVVIQASTDLKTWIPLQTNLLGSGPLYFSDPQSTNNVQRFYRAELLP